MNTSLRLKTFKNVGYNSFARVLVFLFQIPANIVLARQLTSDDYGIVGFSMIFINFLMRFGDLGIGSAVIQKADLDEKGLYTGFTIKFILGFLIFIVAFFLSAIANKFFNNNAVVGVIKVLSLNFIINSFAFIPTSILTKELDYKKLSISQVAIGASTSIISVILVLNGFKYWSIVIANVCATILSAIYLNIVKPVRIRFKYEKKIAAEFLHFGGNLFLSGIIIFLIFNFDNFIIGTVYGSQILGYYAIAFNWGSMVCVTLGILINRTLFPTFSKMQGDRERLRKAYLEVMEYVSFLVVLANMCLLIFSKEFFFVILGKNTDKWLPALTALRILCIYGICRSLLEPIGSVILATGQTKLLLRSNLIVAVAELVIVYPILRYFGIEGVAIAVTVVYSLQYFVYFPYLRKEMNLGFSDFYSAIKPALISGLLLFIGFIVFKQKGSGTSIVFFIIKLFLTIPGYFAVYGFITKWKIVKETRSMVVSWMGQK